MKRLVATGSMAILTVVVATSPARADARIGLSRDGNTWGTSLEGPLFATAAPWVPGESRTATFYVRNQAAEDAHLMVDVLGRTAGSLIDSGDVTITARGGGGSWQQLTAPGQHRLVSALGTGPQDRAPVTVQVAFAPTATNQSELRRLELAFRVTLAQDTSSATDRTAPDGGRRLPLTGAPPLWSGIIGVLLVTAGAALLPRRRREVDAHDPA